LNMIPISMFIDDFIFVSMLLNYCLKLYHHHHVYKRDQVKP
jgi:hypothetical protein